MLKVCWTRLLNSFRIYMSSSNKSGILVIVLLMLILYVISYDATYPFDYVDVLDDSVLTPMDYPRKMPNKHASNDSANHSHINRTCTFCKIYNVSGFARDLGFKCVLTRTTPTVTVCIYNEWEDMYISHDLQYTGLWEPQVLQDFQEALGHYRHAGFIDLGAHVGYYTMIAAKMGHKVIAVEPVKDSIFRIHRALYLEGLGDQVYVLENGVSEKNGKASLQHSGDNQGDNRINLQVRPCMGSCPQVINTITLDDLVDIIRDNFSEAVIKMDIQGFEHRALASAQRLFESVTIQYILMEWSLMAGFYGMETHTSTDKYLVEQMLVFLFERDFRPYSLSRDGGKPLDPHQWHKWPFDIVWQRLPDETEKRTIMANHFRNWPS